MNKVRGNIKIRRIIKTRGIWVRVVFIIRTRINVRMKIRRKG